MFKTFHTKDTIVLRTVTCSQILGRETMPISVSVYAKKLINALNLLGYLREVRVIGKMEEAVAV